ncbi:hypothetical protein FRZ67_05275 [Panacibacter ginsenosidivorans]|uniref:Cytochrome c domain-containing protein n=1 Tax=Panacibacter ginsenosidivorans TaxID=1813871 RepID=A0A5B8V675_9BACT|nr:c-type cytochrome domain-containing protein [Panacibacter ginsenosidivorans]QEC66742.1 hypothetical protein FRZ67_05275 [Panacibacter ginsenosidivorans]
MKKSVYLVVLIVIIFFACQRQVSNPEYNSGGNNADSLANESILDAKAPTVCFEGEVLPIFQTNCAKSGCHDATSHKEGYVFDNYKHITAKGIVPYQPHESEVYQVIAEGEMPPKGNPKLTTEQVTLIRRWIRQGALNTKNCITCDTTQYTYSGTISGIFETNCIGCHSTNNASGGIDLSTYAGASVVALNGRLVGAVTHAPGYSPMPQNAPMLPDCNITQIEKWVAAGAPNN